jgi:hypothetical protein
MSDPAAFTDQQKEAAKFLDRDFNQCFQQMRYYDGQIIDICKFALTGYTAIVGASLSLYKYGIDKGSDFRPPAVAMLAIGLLLGMCLLALLARNRVYFVIVTRYVNEHRELFLAQKPLGFENKTRMYTNPSQPPFFDWRSSQTLLLYALALLNSGLLAIAVYLIRVNAACRWTLVIVLSALFLAAELASAVFYLVSRAKKSPSAAVFGRD